MTAHVVSITGADLSVHGSEHAEGPTRIPSDAELDELHSLAFPPLSQLRPLYFRLEQAKPVSRDVNSLSCVLHSGDVLSADSYLNSFYERYWREYTTVDNVTLEVVARGRLTIEIDRVSSAIGVTEAKACTVGLQDSVTVSRIDVPPPHVLGEGFYGRLYAVFRPISDEVEIISARWLTRCKPQREARVSVVMCTFNKPAAVVGNLAPLAEAFGRVPNLAKFVLVDQGTSKVVEQDSYASAASHSSLAGRVVVIEQANLGGAGGFTRGMLESFADPTITHVLLMDDDVVVDPSVFSRLVAFLKHAKSDVVVGGSMLDLYRRTILHADAERANFDTLVYEPVLPHGHDLCAPGAADRYNEPIAGSYNAWWFCCIPQSAVRQHGLPLPIFVRCDDAEFGTRLTSADYPVVALPGVFVWHEPFYAKFSAGWSITRFAIFWSWHTYEKVMVIARERLHCFGGTIGTWRADYSTMH